MRHGLSLAVAAAVVLGLVAGLGVRALAAEASHAAIAENLEILPAVFLRLVKMVIAPLVFSTLVLGVARTSDASAVGRVALRTLGWFLVASLVSILLGMTFAELLGPGRGLHLIAAQAPPAAVAPFDLRAFVVHLAPQSVVAAMANNEILQIVVFAVIFGIGALALGPAAAPLLELTRVVAEVMLKVTRYVMLAAPLAVFGAISATVLTQGPEVLLGLLRLLGGFYLALVVLGFLLLVALVVGIGRRGLALPGAVRPSFLVAFATASSEAAYPGLLAQLERFGASNRVASFVLPLGYSFNMDGAMMYCAFAVLFIAQSSGIELSWAQKLPLAGLLMVSTKGLAGVPRASLVVITSVLPVFHLPDTGLALILAVDHLLDMGRTGVNVLGNAVATVLVARWEGELTSAAPDRRPVDAD